MQKWKEMKAQKAKMKGNEGPKGHPARIWPEVAIFPLNFAIFPFPKLAICKTKNGIQKNTKEGNQGPKSQNERKWRPKKPKWKEIKGPKASALFSSISKCEALRIVP